MAGSTMKAISTKAETVDVLRQKLNDLIEQARLNEHKLQRFQDLELRITAATSLFDLLCTIIYPTDDHFKWDYVTLLLVDSEHEVRRVLEQEGVKLAEHPALILETRQSSVASLFPGSPTPVLTQYQEHEHKHLFGEATEPPRSIVLLPLLRHQQLIGCVNIGSFSEHWFVRGMSTDFLEHLAAVVAICLENATNLERLRSQGLTDPLTGINNRRFFDQRLTETVTSAQRSHQPLACLMLDVDHFKVVNDNYGHQTGDRVLTEIATLVRTQLRGGDVLCRYGGEEFAALLPDTEATSALEIAERVRESIANCLFTNRHGETFNITISIGVAVFIPDRSLDRNPDMDLNKHSDNYSSGNSDDYRSAETILGEQLVGRADDNLYQCKITGRNRVILQLDDSA